MKYSYFLAILFLVSCSSIDMPNTEESKALISKNTASIEQLNKEILPLATKIPFKNDFQIYVKMEALNQLLDKVSSSRSDDIMIYFPPTKNLVMEKKSILGIDYTNFVNIDTGFVTLNIKRLNFSKMDQNQIFANLDIEGKGSVSISGKHTGVPASVKSGVTITLAEPIKFDIATDKQEASLILRPQAKKMKLNLKFDIKMLEWSIPISHSIDLELTDLIKPIKMPLNMTSKVELPVANTKVGSKNQFEMKPFDLNLSKSQVTTKSNIFEYNTSVNLQKGK